MISVDRVVVKLLVTTEWLWPDMPTDSQPDKLSPDTGYVCTYGPFLLYYLLQIFHKI
jgi:hypothetical protein